MNGGDEDLGNDKALGDNNYMNLGGSSVRVNYRAALELMFLVLAAIGASIAASFDSPWWVYLIILLVLAALIFMAVYVS
jgi:hypothetical protein